MFNKVSKDVTFATVASNKQTTLNNEQTNNNVEQTLLLILAKLDKQATIISTLDERLKRLEYSAKGAIPKSKLNGQLP